MPSNPALDCRSIPASHLWGKQWYEVHTPTQARRILAPTQSNTRSRSQPYTGFGNSYPCTKQCTTLSLFGNLKREHNCQSESHHNTSSFSPFPIIFYPLGCLWRSGSMRGAREPCSLKSFCLSEAIEFTGSAYMAHASASPCHCRSAAFRVKPFRSSRVCSVKQKTRRSEALPWLCQRNPDSLQAKLLPCLFQFLFLWE